MKKDIHPEDYRLVVFKDMSNDYSFLSKSTAASSETIEWEDGSEYPLIKLEISSESHPFFTGKMQFVDTAGRVDKFKKRYAKFDKKKDEDSNVEEPKAEVPKAEESKGEESKGEE